MVNHIVLLVGSFYDRAAANVGIINFVDNDLRCEWLNITGQFDFTIVG